MLTNFILNEPCVPGAIFPPTNVDASYVFANLISSVFLALSVSNAHLLFQMYILHMY